MRESEQDSARERWVLSTNHPYGRLSRLWFLLGGIMLLDGILVCSLYLSVPSSFFPMQPGLLAVFAGMAVYSFVGGAFLRHDSRTIHKDPFPEGSACSSHPADKAYDWCAICGALKCAPDLVRIRQSFWFSPGMFGFDGVACRRCAQRRVKRLLAVSTILVCMFLPLVVISAMNVFMLMPLPLAGLFVLTLGAILLPLSALAFWQWRKGWRVVTTPLPEQPLFMTSTTARLAQVAMVGKQMRFKPVPAPSA